MNKNQYSKYYIKNGMWEEDTVFNYGRDWSTRGSFSKGLYVNGKKHGLWRFYNRKHSHQQVLMFTIQFNLGKPTIVKLYNPKNKKVRKEIIHIE